MAKSCLLFPKALFRAWFSYIVILDMIVVSRFRNTDNRLIYKSLAQIPFTFSANVLAIDNTYDNYDYYDYMRTKLNPIHAGGGGRNPPPLRFFLHNSKTPGDIKKKLSDFNFTHLTVILRILSITIVVRCCHGNLLFPVCHIIFWVEKQRNLNYFQDNYLIKLKFGIGGYF